MGSLHRSKSSNFGNGVRFSICVFSNPGAISGRPFLSPGVLLEHGFQCPSSLNISLVQFTDKNEPADAADATRELSQEG